MKIVVAGGAGYIGSALVPALIEYGYQVVVFDSLWFGNHLPPTVQLVQRDLFTCGPEDLKGVDQVIFLAGLSNDPMAEFSPAKNFVNNGALPAYLAYTAKKAGVRRFIYASSCSVYGYTFDKLFDEMAPAVSAYPYGISKLQGEQAAMYMSDTDYSVIALRQGTVCGYSPRMRFDLIVNTMFKTAMSESVIRVNNPSIWRPVYDLRDAVVAFIRAIQANYSISGIFNVTSDNFTVGQVGDLVKQEMESLLGKKIKLDVKNIGDFRNYKVNIEKARVTLGFMPQYSIKDIIRDLYAHRDRYKNFESDEYYNIKVFQGLP